LLLLISNHCRATKTKADRTNTPGSTGCDSSVRLRTCGKVKNDIDAETNPKPLRPDKKRALKG
jgi:hypothetical protein